MTADAEEDWGSQFPIQSLIDLDFVIGQESEFPVGMMRRSPPEFRRRVLSAAVSYKLQLSSVDYARKKYVEPDTYEGDKNLLGDQVNDFIKISTSILQEELKKLHELDHAPGYGKFGSEMTLYKVPPMLDLTRIVANRGLFLEALPILRLCLEMICWASSVFELEDEKNIDKIEVQRCVKSARSFYATVGRVYGYLSSFSHWQRDIHSNFLTIEHGKAGIIIASARHRAMSLMLCVLLIDILVRVVNRLYGDSAQRLTLAIQGASTHDRDRNTNKMFGLVLRNCRSQELLGIKSLVS